MKRALWLGLVAVVVVACTSTSEPAGSSDVGTASQAEGIDACVVCCKNLFPPGKARGQCVSQAAHGQGPCGFCRGDASADAAPDAPADVAVDAPADVAVDAPADVAADVAEDVAADAAADATDAAAH